MKLSDPLSLINTFLSKVGMSSQSFDENNAMPLSFDNILIGVHKDDKRKLMSVTSVIGKLDDQEDFQELKVAYNKVLEANLANTLMGNGTVGLNQANGMLVYANTVSLIDLTQDAFEAFLERTVNSIEDWHTLIKKGAESVTADSKVNNNYNSEFIKI